MKASEIKKYQQRKKKCKTIGEFKTLGRELRDKYGLTDREAIDLLNDKNVLEIISKYEETDNEKVYDKDFYNSEEMARSYDNWIAQRDGIA